MEGVLALETAEDIAVIREYFSQRIFTIQTLKSRIRPEHRGMRKSAFVRKQGALYKQ